jgi:hypothetical protein
MVGDIAELLIYPLSLPDAALDQTTAYLRAKYFKGGRKSEAQNSPADWINSLTNCH